MSMRSSGIESPLEIKSGHSGRWPIACNLGATGVVIGMDEKNADAVPLISFERSTKGLQRQSSCVLSECLYANQTAAK